MATDKTGVNRAALTRVIAVINGKGGVGKTSLTTNLAGMIAAEADQPVLVVDLDPQANVSRNLGYKGDPTIDDRGRSLASALMWPGEPVRVVTNVRRNLSVIPGGHYLHAAQSDLSSSSKGAKESQHALARVLSTVTRGYSLVLVDCPPGSDALQVAALGAARYVLVAAGGDDATLDGIHEVKRRLAQAVDFNEDVDLLGATLFGVDTKATRVQTEMRRDVDEILEVPGATFRTTIRHSHAVGWHSRRRGLLAHELVEARGQQVPFWDKSKPADELGAIPPTAERVADDYRRLATEMLDRLESKEKAGRDQS